jgi:hypothetical protein
MPEGVADGKVLQRVMDARLSLTSTLHPLLAYLFQVQSRWIDLGMCSWGRHVERIAVGTAWDKADLDSIG